ncbi:MAG: histidine phosphatase family protein, partial [Kiloniellales bacterium]
QGRSDQPLSAAGRGAVLRWRLPKRLVGHRWLTSPLTRARETAALLGQADAAIEPLLTEMDWGAWEGRRLGALRAADPAGMAAEEARGLDLTPPGGESPRRVQERLKPLLLRLAVEDRPTAAVSHKGVIRALYALASGWDMVSRPQAKLRVQCLHVFLLERDGRLRIDSLNLPLAPERAGKGADESADENADEQ